MKKQGFLKALFTSKDKPYKRARRRLKKTGALFLAVLAFMLVLTSCVSQADIDAARAAGGAQTTPAPNTEPGEPLEDGVQGTSEPEEPKGIIDNLVDMFGSRNTTLQIIALLTVLSLAPSILIMFTCFVRIIMILSFTRNAMGLQQMPPNQVLVGLALFLTVFIMMPVFQEIATEAYIPYVAEQIELEEALERGVQPIRTFMIERTRGSDLAMFYEFAQVEPPASEEELLETPMYITIPSYLTSELRRAFEIGFFIYVPFLVIDMIVASTLMAMGMMMLPPTTISMPFKILLFVLVDGWALTFETIISSFY
ncbi:flagellar type III secretion system pore protein FliP [Christensenellaceae bacterium OttesenSCG-928-M15]|nr:flagellar type III secretion system pore protein FliP [Christensenellaceae bacterium OttesenSCG-928-M15]